MLIHIYLQGSPLLKFIGDSVINRSHKAVAALYISTIIELHETLILLNEGMSTVR